MKGIEELRRLAGDIEPDADPVLYDILRDGTENAHGTGPDSERTLSDALWDIFNLFEAEAPTDRERRVLDMWPRFEDGEPVMVGDEFNDHGSRRNDVYSFMFYESGISIRTDSGTLDWQAYGEHVKRPEVLAADGKPLVRGEHVWNINTGREYIVVGIAVKTSDVGVRRVTDNDCEIESYAAEKLTHEQPDTWERWRRDMRKTAYDYAVCVLGDPAMGVNERYDAKARDLERRAKALCERGEE